MSGICAFQVLWGCPCNVVQWKRDGDVLLNSEGEKRDEGVKRKERKGEGKRGRGD